MDVSELMQLWLDRLKIDGPNVFYEKIYEELFELGQAVVHFRYDKVNYNELAEEIADVYMQMEKIMSVHSHVGLANKVLKYKNLKYLQLQKMTYGKEQ